MSWVIKCFKQYADFGGRARRAEFWNFQAFYLVASLVLMYPYLTASAKSESDSFSIAILPIAIFVVLSIIPHLAVTIRRLHDTGRSGWWYFISLIPYVGGIVLLVISVFDSEEGANRWGPNPKEFA